AVRRGTAAQARPAREAYPASHRAGGVLAPADRGDGRAHRRAPRSASVRPARGRVDGWRLDASAGGKDTARMGGNIPAAPEDPQDRTQRLLALDRAHLWHPFTQMQGWIEPPEGDEPVIIDHARGAWIFDTLGRKYLDGVSSLWVNVHGHRKAEIDSAI